MDTPLPPTALRADSTAGGVLLQWDAPLVADGLSSYRVYRFNDTEREFLGEVDASTTSFVDTDVSDEHVYTYYATSVAGRNESPPSNTATANYPNCDDFVGLDPPGVKPECLFPQVGPVRTLLELEGQDDGEGFLI